MHHRNRFIAILVAGTLIFSGGGVALCTGCGEEMMDCCDTPAPSSERLTTKSCCEFRVSAPPETTPALIGPGGPSALAGHGALAAVEIVTIVEDGIDGPLIPVLHPPPRIGGLPLFILNASLRR